MGGARTVTQSGAGHHGYSCFQQRTKNYWHHPNVLWASFLSLLSGTRIQPIFALENHFIDHICAFQLQLPTGHIFFREGASAAHLIAPTCLYADLTLALLNLGPQSPWTSLPGCFLHWAPLSISMTSCSLASHSLVTAPLTRLTVLVLLCFFFFNL